MVYLVDEELDFLFYRHIEQLRRCTNQPFKIYAAVHRLGQKYLDHLRALDFVEICNLAPTQARASHEHAHYLDQLAETALADGATRLATFDVDSFPVRSDWISFADKLLSEGRSLVGVFRQENGDKAVPHPSFMFFGEEFYRQYRPTFRFNDKAKRSIAFMKATGQRRLDTAAGYGIVIHENKLRWAKLVRSNRVNEHPLLGGIYGGWIFHFGGGSRDKVFSVDVRLARKTRPTATLQELWPGIAARNEALAQSMAKRMVADFDGYIRYLNGQ